MPNTADESLLVKLGFPAPERLRGLVRQLWGLFEPPGRRSLVALTAMMVLGSALEAVGIGLVLPFLDAVMDAQPVLNHPVAGPLLERIGIDSRDELVLAAGIGLVVVFLLKNGYIAYLWHRVYGFFYGQYVRIARRLLDGYLRAPYSVHLQRNSAELTRNTVDEANRVFTGAMQPAMDLVAETTVAAGLVLVLTLTHAVAAGLVLGVMAVLGWALTASFRKHLRRIGRERAEHQGRVYQAVNQGLGGIKEVRILGREDYFVDAFHESAHGLADSLRQIQVIKLLPRLALETGAVAAMVGLAGILVVTEQGLADAIPVLGVFAVAIVRLMPSVNRVVSDINNLRYNVPAIEIVHGELERVEAWRDRELAPVDPKAMDLKERLELRELTYTYPGKTEPALEGVDFALDRGEAVGIVGPSGAGKSTLVNLTLGVLQPATGAVRVDGRDIREDLPAWQRHVGYIPQEIYLTDDTVARNVAFGVPDDEIDRQRMWEVLEAAQIADFVRELDRGPETVVGEHGLRISGGQRQRIGIARALYRDPDLLVLDEATSSLDFETERRVMRAVERVAGGRTLLIVTHRIRTVRGCDAIHVLDGGRLVDAGTYEELMAGSPLFRRLAREEDTEETVRGEAPGSAP